MYCQWYSMLCVHYMNVCMFCGMHRCSHAQRTLRSTVWSYIGKDNSTYSYNDDIIRLTPYILIVTYINPIFIAPGFDAIFLHCKEASYQILRYILAI